MGWMLGPLMIVGALQFGAGIVFVEGLPNHPDHNRLWDIVERNRVTLLGIAPTAAAGVQVRTHLEVILDALRPWAADRRYLNFAESRHDPRAFWPHDTHERLCRAKATADPDNLIRSNHPVD